MKTHGLLFSAPMIRAFLRPVDPKTQTRRKITAANSLVDGNGMSAKRWAEMNFDFSRSFVSLASYPQPFLHVPARNVKLNGNEETWHRIYPRIDVGDVIYAKETWNRTNPGGDDGVYFYRADLRFPESIGGGLISRDTLWKSSMFMPERAARIRRTVTAVRPEPLLQISDDDAKAEGLTALSKDGALVKYGIPDIDGLPGTDDHGWQWHEWRISPIDAYFTLWNQLNGKNAHLQNPRVWVYTLGAA